MIAILSRVFGHRTLAPAPKRTGLARFDDATRAELDALPPRVRCAVVKDRKLRVTRELERFVASGGAR